MKNTQQEVFDFVQDRHWKFWKKMTLMTKLEDDLGLTGDDAIEFMQLFFEKFSVDGSNFVSSRYFYYEGFDTLGNSILSIFRRRIRQPKQDITLLDLINSIEIGKWIDPISPQLR